MQYKEGHEEAQLVSKYNSEIVEGGISETWLHLERITKVKVYRIQNLFPFLNEKQFLAE